MSERFWELPSSAALDGELDAAETLELLDAMADDPDCRKNWQRLRDFDHQLDPMVEPASKPLPRPRRIGRLAGWALVPAAALIAVLLLGPDMTRIESLPDPDGQPLTVRLQENQGEMTDTRFVELVVEVLQADHRYQEKMREVLEEVRPEASLAEAGSSEDDTDLTERVAFANEYEPAISIDELPWEALAGIH